MDTPQPSTTEDMVKQKIMREIKFRVFFYDGLDYKSGQIMGVDEAYLENYIEWIDGGLKASDECAILMQFTGLKDKNGVEIYEGDILEHNGKKYEVKFSENQFNLLLKDVGSKTNWRSLEWCNNVSKYINIIGNIYQNPELLK